MNTEPEARADDFRALQARVDKLEAERADMLKVIVALNSRVTDAERTIANMLRLTDQMTETGKRQAAVLDSIEGNIATIVRAIQPAAQQQQQQRPALRLVDAGDDPNAA